MSAEDEVKKRRKPKHPVAPVVNLGDARAQRDAEQWRAALRFNQHGKMTKDPGNLVLSLVNDPAWAGTLTWDEFSERMRWAKEPPPLAGFARPTGEVKKAHILYVHHYFARAFGVSFGKHDVWDALEAAAMERPTHAVRDWLKALAWDGQRRVENWLATYFGAEDNGLNQAIGRMWLVSAVARVCQPGCQADHMLVLRSAQGSGKSTGLGALFGDEWYLGKLPNIQDEVRAASMLRGKWGIEVGELDAFRGAAATRVKDFLSQRYDDFRGAYERLEQKRPRQCVFAGSTNEGAFLGDATGARRFWIVRVGLVDRYALGKDREQLWAEALAMYESSVRWWPERGDHELQSALSELQDEHYTGDEWETKINSWLTTRIDRDAFTAGDVLGGPIGLEPAKWDKAAQTRVGQCLSRLGYERYRLREGAARVYRYRRVSRDQESHT